MTRLLRGMLCIAMLASMVQIAGAFSLIGPFKDARFDVEPWQDLGYGGQPRGLGYRLQGDIGGPMFPFEAYRWNIPVITYAYDFTFLRYFGTNGVAAVEEAIAILNALPPASRMSENLSEYPLDTRSANQMAAELGLRDVRSTALSVLLEQMGLANPERFVWGLRGRFTFQNTTNYSVIQMNYDPITIQPSRFVNGVLYNYQIFDALGRQGDEWASALEWFQLDPLYQPYSAVAGKAGGGDFQLGSSPGNPGVPVSTVRAGLLGGDYYTGLTRDDVGGLRYLLSTNNMVFETLPLTVLPRLGGTRGSPWAPVVGAGLTNGAALTNLVTTVGTNGIFTNFVRTALRPGLDKLTFQRVGLLGNNFNPITLRYTDRFINPTNGRIVKQSVERLVTAPDIVFSVRDIGLAPNSATPLVYSRTTTDGWTNNAALNTYNGTFSLGIGGPGNITPGIEIIFQDLYSYWSEIGDGSIEDEFSKAATWGHFDGTTRPPVVFPIYPDPVRPEFSLEYLQDVVLKRTGN